VLLQVIVHRLRELVEVVLAARLVGRVAHRLHGRQHQPDQDAKHRKGHENLDERERPALLTARHDAFSVTC